MEQIKISGDMAMIELFENKKQSGAIMAQFGAYDEELTCCMCGQSKKDENLQYCKYSDQYYHDACAL